jgi:hypothetical protein
MFAFRKIFTVPAVTSVAAASSSSSAALCSKAATLFSSSAAANLCAVRYCSAAAPAATSTPTPSSSSSSGGNRYQDRRGNFNRDRDQRRNSSSGGNFRNNNSGSSSSGRNAVQPLRANVEFYDVRDSPKDGRELRLSFRSDVQQRSYRSQDQHAKQLTLTILPQLGPRKTDPHDPTPQFDNAARVGLRLRAQEVAEILMWLVGRNKADSHTLGSTNTRIELKKHDSGVITVAVTARKLDGNMGEPLAFELQPHQQVQFRIFLEESMYAYWDFSAF